MSKDTAVIAKYYKDPSPIHIYSSSTSSTRGWPGTHTYTAHEIRRGSELGITAQEYRERCKRILDVNLQWKRVPGQLVRPSSDEDFKKYGYMRVRAVCKTYDEYVSGAGDEPWNPGVLYLLAVYSEKNPNETINCTLNWVEPVDEFPTKD